MPTSYNDGGGRKAGGAIDGNVVSLTTGSNGIIIRLFSERSELLIACNGIIFTVFRPIGRLLQSPANLLLLWVIAMAPSLDSSRHCGYL